MPVARNYFFQYEFQAEQIKATMSQDEWLRN
jgi:hypothetical protein